MSTDVTSPSPPASSSVRTTGSADNQSLAPAPPPTAPDADFATDAGTSRSTAVSEFAHGMTASIGR